ncbi:MAG: N-acetylmuramoyl-L-alanine amidase [Acidobacteriota bacterium]|nr:N-acetylmuramoyl-L-alanine amidase [Acidobacteriota bacterium]
MVSSCAVTRRRPLASLPLLLLLVPVLLLAQAAATTPTVTLDGREVRVPVNLAPGGPLFGLKAMSEALGGELARGETGESYTLKVGGKEIVVGLGSAVVTVGDTIVSLSQPPTRGEGGLAVPLDFLAKTYGDLAGYSFDWRPEQQRLLIGRRSARELPVALDVVHLQGMTTIVLQFSDVPRYHLNQQPGRIEVQMLADHLAVPSPQRKVEDPLVKAVDIAPERVRIDLAPEAAVESYTLENPFRLVFDVHGEAAVTTPAGPAFPSPAPPASGIHTIVIDPGHGGTETGAIGPGGVQEKGLTLLLAQALAGRLQQKLPVRVVLTRSEDANLPLDTRAAIANQNKADLFISIHLNSSLGAGAHGAETYFLSAQATDKRAASSASAENAENAGKGGPPGADGAPQGTEASQDDLRLILWDLAQTRHLSESQRLANLIQEEFNEALKLKDRGVKQAPFRVLMGAAMPAVLVEVGFLSNPEEEGKLQDADYRADLVEALVRAVTRYKALAEAPENPTPTNTPAAGAGTPTPSAGSPPVAKPPAAAVPKPARPPGGAREP